MEYKGLACNSVKIMKERVSLLLTANWDGSEKLKPVVIGQSAKPRCFKSLNTANLPVYYRNNTKAWMNETIFKEWLLKLDKRFKSQNRKIILFLDNFSGHSPNRDQLPYNLTNIKLVYFPANCTSVIQPMDQGIIQSFKMKYKRLVVEDKINSIEYGYDMPTITILKCIDYINKAWNTVTATTITNTFKKAGFKSETVYSLEELIDQTEELSEINEFNKSLNALNQKNSIFDFTFNEFLNIDDELPAYGQLEDEEIIQEILNKPIENEKESDTEDQEQQIHEQPISRLEASNHLQAFKLFFLQSKSDSSQMIAKIEEIENIFNSSRSANKQTSILNFFK